MPGILCVCAQNNGKLKDVWNPVRIGFSIGGQPPHGCKKVLRFHRRADLPEQAGLLVADVVHPVGVFTGTVNLSPV